MSDESVSPAPESPEAGAPDTGGPLIPTDRRSMFHEFKDFIIYNKAWWLTPIVVIVALMVAFILFAESSPVLPFIYTVI